MKNQTIEFKVAMNKEEKDFGNVHTVKLNVSFEGVDESTIAKHAMANMVVAWQGQIRNNWTAFTEGKLPETITFGIPLFEGKNRVGVTVERAVEAASKMDAETLARMIKQLQALQAKA